MPKIVLIGAGSAMFTRGLMADLIQSPDLGPWEVGLVDTDPNALQTAVGLCERIVKARPAEIHLSAAVDRRELLGGADVVVATIGVGGRRAWEADVLIPRRYGIYQPVGDTVMPGGISRAMRMIPALVAIARDLADLCPEALFMNYSNPMTANCWAVRQATGVPVVGLCHGTFHVEAQLASFIGAAPEEVTSLYAGLNHLTFIYDLRWRGMDAWPLVRARLDPYLDRGHAAAQDEEGPFPVAENPFSWSLFRTYGAYPACNDRHVTEFFPERFPRGAYNGHTLGVDAYSFEGTIAHGDEIYARMRDQALGRQPLDEAVFGRTAGEHEQLIAILRSVWGDTRGVFAANLPNRGTVTGLPDDAILEMPAVATGRGLNPLQRADLSAALTAVMAGKLAVTSLTVEAALRADRDLFVEALLADGSIDDPDVARRLGADLLQAQRAYLRDWEFAD